MHRQYLLGALLIATALLVVASPAVVPVAEASPLTALDEYCAKPDSTYMWKINSTQTTASYTWYNVYLRSQTWLTAADSSRSVWEHWLQVIVPRVRDSDMAFMYINGDHNSDTPPSTPDVLTELVAVETRTIAATVLQIPNEPIYFTGENKRRSEDAIIAYTWRHFIEDPTKPEWLLRLPMTKAVLRAMDATEELVKGLSGVKPISGWGVGGASKRGWTTWTVGAADAVLQKRVKALVPIVMDALNLVENINHMWQAYGFWTFAFEDYTALNTTLYLNTPQFAQMAAIIDPFAYRDRLTMPKYVIDATGDEFFQMDDNWYWFGQLPGETYLRMVPNAEHSLTGHQVDVTLAVSTFWRSVALNLPRPTLTWTRDEKTGRIEMTANPKPDIVEVWTGYNYKARDFRLAKCEDLTNPDCIQLILWTEKRVEPDSNGKYVAELPIPETGYRGYFIQADWRSDEGMVGEHWFKFTTQVSIVPSGLPYPPCGNPCGPPGEPHPHFKPLDLRSEEPSLVDQQE